MATPGFLCFAGVPIASNARTLAYARAGYAPRSLRIEDCGTCSDDFWMFDNDDAPYSTPTGDDMPWVSASEPESADFAGLYIVNIEGLEIAPLDRQITDRIGDGATLGRARYPARTISVTGILLGRTCQAAQWGLRWLAHELRDNPCGAGNPCLGADLEYLLSCPDDGGSCLLPGTPSTDPFDVQANRLMRTLHRVGLLTGPTVTDRVRLSSQCGVNCAGGCCLPVVTFELVAGDPYAYREAVATVPMTLLTPCDVDPTCIQWVVVEDDELCPDPCNPTISCAEDPACPTPPAPPQVPLVADACACDPLQVATTCVQIDAGDFFDVGDTLPLVHVEAGATDLRGVKISFTPNPLETSFDRLDICAVCYEINLPFLPAHGTWHFDASTRSSVIVCSGGEVQVADVSGPNGGPFTWPVFTCPGIAYAMCLDVDCSSVNAEASLRIELVNRHA